MQIAFDRRDALQNTACTHALIVGTSWYRDRSIHRLGSACLSAHAVYRWIVTNADRLTRPLGSCRLLLSPTVSERRAEAELLDPENTLGAQRSTFDNFRDAVVSWRNDAIRHKDNMTLFYLAGHGISLGPSRGYVVLEDTSFPGVSTDELTDAVVGTAKDQLYFFDCCREMFEDDGYRPLRRPAAAPQDKTVYFACGENRQSYSNGRRSYFSQALIDCLDRDAIVLREHDGELKPCVTQGSLSRALLEKVPALLYPPELGRWEPPERRQVPEWHVASPEMPIVSV